ncbi:acetyltransferase [Cyanobacteria bacterium FACHB-472]|nr:acetyltransferase [Cyanobacteria bacterium FACHB-472]
MFLKDKESGSLIEISDIQHLISPTSTAVTGRDQAGQEEQEPITYQKEKLVFPSGESLPICWMDENYTT